MKQTTLSKKDYFSMSKIIPVVEIKTVTWDRESHNLFDYANSYYDLKKFVLGSSANLIRRKNEVNIQAVKSTAIVSSLFPEAVRDRLMDGAYASGKNRLKSFLNDTLDSDGGHKPIADMCK